MIHAQPYRRAALATLAGLLVACGGEPQDPGSARDRAPGVAATATSATDDGLPRADDGAARPADPGAHTLAGLYTTADRAERLARTMSGAVLWVEIGCCGEEAVEQAMGIAHALQAAHDLPASAPVLVRSQDLRLAAAVVNRLAVGGHGPVWLVTP